MITIRPAGADEAANLSDKGNKASRNTEDEIKLLSNYCEIRHRNNTTAFDESKEILNQKSMKQLEWLDNARSKYMANLQKKHRKTYKKVYSLVQKTIC